MTCKCGSTRILDFNCKHNDLASVRIPHLKIDHDGYNPLDGKVFSGDYTSFEVCMDCGSIQNWTPITDDDVRAAFEVDEEEFDNLEGEDYDKVVTLDDWMRAGRQDPDATVKFTHKYQDHQLDINEILGYRNRAAHYLESEFGRGWRGNGEAKAILHESIANPSRIVEAAAAYMILKEIE